LNNETSKGLLRLGTFLVLSVCVVAVTVSRVVQSRARVPSAGHPTDLTAADRQRVRQLLLDGVAASVTLPTEGARPGQVQASVESVRDFIRGRSGLELAPEVTAKLAAIDQRTLDGNASRISCDDLSDSVLGALVERFRHCSDAEIEKAADALGNVKTAGPKTNDSSASGAGKLMLRANGQGVMSRAEFVESAKRYRALVNVPVQLIALVGIVRPVFRLTFKARLNTLSQALPEQWGDAPTRGLTPTRAFLLTYSAVSDDMLGRSMPDLQQHMKWAEGVRTKADPSYPSSAGAVPFGTNGYLFSSPVNLLLTQQTSIRLLDKIAERTSK
jgi:hypothetical protein